MRTGLVFIPAVFLICLAGCWPGNRTARQPAISQLQLISALPVDIPAPLEPSGLVKWEGQFFTVADKDDTTIYKVELMVDKARMVPYLEFQPPDGYRMDWEGITVDPAGNFYLVSENYSRILKVQPSGDCQWVSPDLSEIASKTGLFAKSNAGFEGITWLGPEHWLAAVEREPRGLVEFKLENGSEQVTPAILEQSPFSNVLTLLRIPDYSGLCTDNGAVYALFRNAHLVVQLERVSGIFEEKKAWSYQHIETDPTIAYIEQTYGQAEGLVVREKDVYLIFDNNLGGRMLNPNDGRPLFVHARMK